ncbi:MAG TPA: DUF2164 family protein [Burkholderiales bacterium]|jgi:uncharacterized protein (DUF2164 family)|nr:DUF2164 family protein [Burkholderiales bacterium]
MVNHKIPKVELSKAKEKAALEELKKLVQERFDVQLGLFEAKELLDEVCALIGVSYYNQALADVDEKLKLRFEMIESDLWLLEK